MATYSGTIDLRVTGNALKEIDLITKRANELRALTKSLKPVPNLFDKNQKDPKIVKAKKDLKELVEQYGKGVGAGKRFSNTLAGLNAQISAFGRIIGNVNTNSDEFVQAITAQEKASRRLAKAEAARLKVQMQINTANTVGRATSVQETLDLGKVIPKSIAGLELYQQELQETIRNVEIGSQSYRELEAAIAGVNRQLNIAQGKGPVQGPALPPGFTTEEGRLRGPSSPIRGGVDIVGSPAFRKQRRQNVFTGAGFPLLFGGGPLQSLAGGIGGALGGLGGSIAASAVVSQIEKFVQGIAEAGQALDAFSGDVGKIAEMTGTAGNESIKYAKALEDLGFKQSALQIATQQAAQVIGTQGVGALQLFAEDSKRLSEATARLGLKIQAFFAQALGGFTNLIAQIVERLGGAKPADTGSAPARALAVNQVTKFNQQELNILRQEFAIKKLISEEDAKQKQVAQAQLALSELDLEIKKERRKAVMAQQKEDIVGELQAKNAEFLLGKKRHILELELSQAEAAKRVYDQYTAQADALQGVVHQSKMRLNQETAVLEGRNKLTGAYYSAELKVNQLAIQRAKQKGKFNLALQLEIKQVDLIYKQTVAQIQAEVERARLKARQVALSLKELEVDNLRKQAAGNLQDADRQALALKRQALDIAKHNVQVTEKVAEQQIRGAYATGRAAIESLKFAANQEKAAQAANNTANAMSRAARASAAAAQAAPAVEGNGDTFMVNGKKYTYQGSKTASQVGSGVTIVTKSHQFSDPSNTAALQSAIERGQSAGPSKSYPSSADQSVGPQRRPTRTVHIPGGGSITTVGNTPGLHKIPGGGSVFYANAEGSYVTRPITSLIGERGENEYVIPESKMNSAMKRYARGARGETVVEGSGETSAAGRRASGAVVNISTGPVMRMDDQDYVTVSDLNDAVGSVAAAMSSGSEVYGGSTRLS